MKDDNDTFYSREGVEPKAKTGRISVLATYIWSIHDLTLDRKSAKT